MLNNPGQTHNHGNEEMTQAKDADYFHEVENQKQKNFGKPEDNSSTKSRELYCCNLTKPSVRCILDMRIKYCYN